MQVDYNDDYREITIRLDVSEAIRFEDIITTHCFGSTIPNHDELFIRQLLALINHELEK